MLMSALASAAVILAATPTWHKTLTGWHSKYVPKQQSMLRRTLEMSSMSTSAALRLAATMDAAVMSCMA
jgi:hypothetical protein